jgi:hypothetical protein
MDQDKTKAAKNRGEKKTELSYVLSVVFASVAANCSCSCSLFSSCGELHLRERNRVSRLLQTPFPGRSPTASLPCSLARCGPFPPRELREALKRADLPKSAKERKGKKKREIFKRDSFSNFVTLQNWQSSISIFSQIFKNRLVPFQVLHSNAE